MDAAARMHARDLDWGKFAAGRTPEAARIAFESLCGLLFARLIGRKEHEISRPAALEGIECVPLLGDEADAAGNRTKMWSSYQSKFQKPANWGKFTEAVKFAAKRKQEGDPDFKSIQVIHCFSNNTGSKKAEKRSEAEAAASAVGIKLLWHFGDDLLTLLDSPAHADLRDFHFFREELPPLRDPRPEVPTTSASLDFAAEQPPFVGRGEELTRLGDFLNDDRPFGWWAVVGPMGSGKSRLALELVKRALRLGFHAGWLPSDTLERPYESSNASLLIVVEDVVGRELELGRLLDRLCNVRPNGSSKRRVLFIERATFDWSDGLLAGMESEAAVLGGHWDDPLPLGGLAPPDADRLREAAGLPAQDPGSPASAGSNEAELFPMNIVLSAMGMDGGEKQVWEKAYRLERKRLERLSDDERLILAVATIVGGLSLRDPARLSAELCELVNRTDLSTLQSLTGGSTTDEVAALRPDFIGEAFCLEAFFARAASDYPENSVLLQLTKNPRHLFDTDELRARWVATGLAVLPSVAPQAAERFYRAAQELDRDSKSTPTYGVLLQVLGWRLIAGLANAEGPAQALASVRWSKDHTLDELVVMPFEALPQTIQLRAERAVVEDLLAASREAYANATQPWLLDNIVAPLIDWVAAVSMLDDGTDRCGYMALLEQLARSERATAHRVAAAGLRNTLAAVAPAHAGDKSRLTSRNPSRAEEVLAESWASLKKLAGNSTDRAVRLTIYDALTALFFVAFGLRTERSQAISIEALELASELLHAHPLGREEGSRYMSALLNLSAGASPDVIEAVLDARGALPSDVLRAVRHTDLQMLQNLVSVTKGQHHRRILQLIRQLGPGETDAEVTLYARVVSLLANRFRRVSADPAAARECLALLATTCLGNPNNEQPAWEFSRCYADCQDQPPSATTFAYLIWLAVLGTAPVSLPEAPFAQLPSAFFSEAQRNPGTTYAAVLGQVARQVAGVRTTWRSWTSLSTHMP